MKYVAIIVKTGKGYSAHLPDLPDLPGYITAGNTFEETKRLIQEAVVSIWKGWSRTAMLSPSLTAAPSRCRRPSPARPRKCPSRQVDNYPHPLEKEGEPCQPLRRLSRAIAF